MRSLFKNYKMSLMLILSILLGGAVGVVLGPKAKVLEPFGQIFLNLMFTIIVPLVFFSVASAIANMSGVNRLGKIMITIILVFISTAIISGVLAIIGSLVFNPTKGLNSDTIKNILSQGGADISKSTENISLSQQLVKTFTVSDFSELFSKNNMLQIIVFSVFFGVATTLVGEKGEVVRKFIDSVTAIIMKIVNIIMYYAPIGLACYFASVVGQLGTQILQGYLKVFLLYLGLTIINYFIFFSVYSYISSGKEGFKAFWKNVISPTVTALATCSSAASIPVNLEATKKIGVPKDIAETVIPLGVNTHKDGSVIGGVLKIIFLFGLFGKDINSIQVLLSILAVGFLVGAVMGAIPGGGMIGEMLIISIYGFPIEALPIIAVISTIIDAPATVLNSTGNTVCAMLVSRFVDGKKWLMKV
ncbi:dicarboxylate/amino acid:cation symporter [Clostridium folliculivorans]|uniref:Sodium:dicarboxylate symporter n=1 Tax=Clostridium folliculivorans TaxID=2886038 RepID=A0A9W5Y1V1_9CLOT|nr:dicarboxylate/amino acid:cation symporter [Clostridium folliculivorans]GKU24980.1 sodium:dicarboxylate symporter [Clostridium folliculivorans]GKU31078.1 sodium:dicarboxylate symporter [Clostridium folliculivorans]